MFKTNKAKNQITNKTKQKWLIQEIFKIIKIYRTKVSNKNNKTLETQAIKMGK